MVFDFCTHCAKSQISTWLCNDCFDHLRPITYQDESGPLRSLFSYDGTLRNLVLRAKVASDLRALVVLADLFCSSPKAQSLCEWAHAIMPVPSSLWSRLRGKVDLGGALATELALRHQKPLRRAPSHLMWRWAKRAQEKHRKPEPLVLLKGKDKTQRVLLVDDVVTTASSLNRVAESLEEGIELRFLTLASAYHRDISD